MSRSDVNDMFFRGNSTDKKTEIPSTKQEEKTQLVGTLSIETGEKITLDLDKSDIINMIMGTTPSYRLLHKVAGKTGTYIGGQGEKWARSEYALQQLSLKELLELYNLLKKDRREN